MKVSLTIEHEGKEFALAFTLTDEEMDPSNFLLSQPWDMFAVNLTELVRAGMMQFTILTDGDLTNYMFHARLHREKLTQKMEPLPMEIRDDGPT